MADYLTHPLLDDFPGIRHAFFTRNGGTSSGIYTSLNCGVGSADEPSHVRENRARAAALLGIPADRLATPYQVHGTGAVAVTTPWPAGQGPKADALVTDRPGIAIGVGSADCGPTLFADAEAGVVGASHSGWKGALAGVLESTVAAMERLGARRERIAAVLGPTISQPNYEVGPEFPARFTSVDPDWERFFEPAERPGYARFDLPGFVVARLGDAGVKAEWIGLCTYAGEDRFFSYRRATHRGEPDYGRLLSAIAISRG